MLNCEEFYHEKICVNKTKIPYRPCPLFKVVQFSHLASVVLSTL